MDRKEDMCGHFCHFMIPLFNHLIGFRVMSKAQIPKTLPWDHILCKNKESLIGVNLGPSVLQSSNSSIDSRNSSIRNHRGYTFSSAKGGREFQTSRLWIGCPHHVMGFSSLRELFSSSRFGTTASSPGSSRIFRVCFFLWFWTQSQAARGIVLGLWIHWNCGDLRFSFPD